MSAEIGTDKKGKCILKIDDPYHSTGSPKTPLHVVKDSSDADDTGGLIFLQQPNKWLHLTVFGIKLTIILSRRSRR